MTSPSKPSSRAYPMRQFQPPFSSSSSSSSSFSSSSSSALQTPPRTQRSMYPAQSPTRGPKESADDANWKFFLNMYYDFTDRQDQSSIRMIPYAIHSKLTMKVLRSYMNSMSFSSSFSSSSSSSASSEQKQVDDQQVEDVMIWIMRHMIGDQEQYNIQKEPIVQYIRLFPSIRQQAKTLEDVYRPLFQILFDEKDRTTIRPLFRYWLRPYSSSFGNEFQMEQSAFGRLFVLRRCRCASSEAHKNKYLFHLILSKDSVYGKTWEEEASGRGSSSSSSSSSVVTFHIGVNEIINPYRKEDVKQQWSIYNSKDTLIETCSSINELETWIQKGFPSHEWKLDQEEMDIQQRLDALEQQEAPMRGRMNHIDPLRQYHLQRMREKLKTFREHKKKRNNQNVSFDTTTISPTDLPPVTPFFFSIHDRAPHAYAHPQLQALFDMIKEEKSNHAVFSNTLLLTEWVLSSVFASREFQSNLLLLYLACMDFYLLMMNSQHIEYQRPVRPTPFQSPLSESEESTIKQIQTKIFTSIPFNLNGFPDTLDKSIVFQSRLGQFSYMYWVYSIKEQSLALPIFAEAQKAFNLQMEKDREREYEMSDEMLLEADPSTYGPSRWFEERLAEERRKKEQNKKEQHKKEEKKVEKKEEKKEEKQEEEPKKVVPSLALSLSSPPPQPPRPQPQLQSQPQPLQSSQVQASRQLAGGFVQASALPLSPSSLSSSTSSTSASVFSSSNPVLPRPPAFLDENEFLPENLE